MNLEEVLYAIRNLVHDQKGKIKTLEELNQQLRGRNEGLVQRVEHLEARVAGEHFESVGWQKRAEAAEAKLAQCIEALELGLALAEGALIDFKHYGLKTDDDIAKRIEVALAAVRREE